jgi:hypothetical protein
LVTNPLIHRITFQQAFDQAYLEEKMRDFRILGLLLAAVFSLSFGCAQENNVSTENVQDEVEDLFETDLISSGQFSGKSGHSTTGNASLFYSQEDNVYTVVLDEFLTDNGPSLVVYLSDGTNPGNFVNLGALKSIQGTHRYQISGEDLDIDPRYVLIWCDRFSVNFGDARLE